MMHHGVPGRLNWMWVMGMGKITYSTPTERPTMSDQNFTAVPAAVPADVSTAVRAGENMIACGLYRAAHQARASSEVQRADLLALAARIADLTAVAYTSERQAEWAVAITLIEGHLQKAAATIRATALSEARTALTAVL